MVPQDGHPSLVPQHRSSFSVYIANSGSVYGQHPRQRKGVFVGDSWGVLTIRHIESAVGIHSEQLDSGAMAQDMRTLSMLVGPIEGGSGEVQLVIVKCPLLATCQPELSILAGKYCLVHGLLQYTGETIKQIKEAWETILLELASYAENNPPGTVAADFLELLMFGVMISPQLENFLHQEMTEKKIVVGVTEDVVERALYRSKGVELQQVIDESMKNLKVFFRWVYVEILRLSD